MRLISEKVVHVYQSCFFLSSFSNCLPGIFIYRALITVEPGTIPIHACNTVLSWHALACSPWIRRAKRFQGGDTCPPAFPCWPRRTMAQVVQSARPLVQTCLEVGSCCIATELDWLCEILLVSHSTGAHQSYKGKRLIMRIKWKKRVEIKKWKSLNLTFTVL